MRLIVESRAGVERLTCICRALIQMHVSVIFQMHVCALTCIWRIALIVNAINDLRGLTCIWFFALTCI